MRQASVFTALLAAIAVPAAAVPLPTLGFRSVIVGADCPSVPDFQTDATGRLFCTTPLGTVLDGGVPLPGENLIEVVRGTANADSFDTQEYTSAGTGAAVRGEFFPKSDPLSLLKLGVRASSGRYGTGYGALDSVFGFSSALPGARTRVQFEIGLDWELLGDPLDPSVDFASGTMAIFAADAQIVDVDLSSPEALSCGAPSVLGIAKLPVLQDGQLGSAEVTGCDGEAGVWLETGQSYYLTSTIEAFAYRGGIVDGFNTLTVGLADVYSDQEKKQILKGLRPLDVPEPRTLGLFGVALVVGAGLRTNGRRSREYSAKAAGT